MAKKTKKNNEEEPPVAQLEMEAPPVVKDTTRNSTIIAAPELKDIKILEVNISV